jgi:STE24 endopeptidase
VPDESLRNDIVALADEAGISVDEVVVADASRRTTAENAYVGGLGATKRVVLFDTLLENDNRGETLFVVAHELGHEKENHVLKGIALASAGLLVGFGALAWLASRDWFFSWAGASGVRDLRGLPVLLLFLALVGLAALPIENVFSRSFERRSDEIAIDLTGNPESGVGLFRRLAFTNIADLRPPDIAVGVLFTHPPIPERIESLLTGESDAGAASFADLGAVKQD